MKLVNAVSAQMVTPEVRRNGFMFDFMPIDKPDLSKLESCIGHKATADYLGVAFNRESLQLNYGEQVILYQLTNGRLEEGATELPPGSTAEWMIVEVCPRSR